MLRKSDTEYLNMTAANLLYASNDALTEYSFLEKLTRKHFEENSITLEKAQSTFELRQKEMQAAGDKFQQGVKDWKHEQEIEAVKKGILAAVEVIGAIALTVATFGAAAPVAVAATASAATKVSKIAQLIAKIKEIVEKLKKIYEKFKPMIETLKKLMDAVKKIVAIIDTAKAIAASGDKLEPASTDMDMINGTRVWDDFVVDVAEMFAGLQEYDINNKGAYEVSLRKMSNAGKAVLAGQTALITSGEALVSIKLKQKLQTGQQARLEGAVGKVKGNDEILAILKRAMFDRVIAIRGMAFLDFWNYSMAYQYHTLSIGMSNSFKIRSMMLTAA